MQSESVSFYQSKLLVFLCQLFFWPSLILFISGIARLFKPGEAIFADLFFVFLLGFIAFATALSCHYNYVRIELRGSIMTVTRGRWWRQVKTIDWQQVTKLWVRVSPISGATPAAVGMLIKDGTGLTVPLRIGQFKPEQRELLWPHIYDTVQRLGIESTGPNTAYWLKVWYGDKASVIAKP